MDELSADTGKNTVRNENITANPLGRVVNLSHSSTSIEGLPNDFVAGSPLPNSLLGGKDDLSLEGRKELKRLTGARPVPFLSTLAVTWLSIVATMAVAAWMDAIWFYLFAIIFIGTRQNILGLLIHEQTHYLCSSHPWADAVTNLFAGWPIIVVSVENYAKVHLAHHSFYFTEKDPDFIRKKGKDWTFPMKPHSLFLLFLKDLMGGTFFHLISSKKIERQNQIRRPQVLPGWLKLFYYASIIALSVWFGIWKLLLLLWVLPLLLVLPVIVRFSAICEHKYDVLSGKIEESTATIILNKWERALLPRLNFNYHIYHHYFPGISFCNLQKVHALFEKEG
ncbi:MAG TPA: hypothetical protein DCZ03_04130, partial [Gammaproteobacteria bacterium]|nr:hypothetical protein [Gammaproteobacteria bacterium]